ncbi:uncharacterized protein LOC141620021 [Silene latifolia]|uniref:uncharacterized protein LOC141620021 n=1 Tax=Silene latifolia TaxID=37657 RepID=UPI003D76B20B
MTAKNTRSSSNSSKNIQEMQQNSNKFDVLSQSNMEEFPALTRNSHGPSTSDARKEKNIHEVVGVPALNLEVLVEDESYTEESTHKSATLAVIEEEPEEQSGLIQFTAVEVKVEMDHWKNSVYCFILGANPPWDIVEGFIRRLWMNHQGHFLFGNKPLIVKPWTPEVELIKHEVKSIPVWIKLHKLPLKFWGKEKTRIGYARVMIEVQIGQTLPDTVKFLDENGDLVVIGVEFEWKPLVCDVCKGIGHGVEDCRKAKKPVAPTKRKPGAKPAVNNFKTPAVGHKVSTASFGPNPARPIIRLSRQEISDGGYTVHRFGQHTFLKSLNGSITPKVGIGVGLFGLLETKIKALSLNSINGILVNGWSISTNNRWHKGGRILILWNPNIFHIDFIDYSAQCINMRVTEMSSNKRSCLSMVYAFNDLHDRHPLWEQLIKFAVNIHEPWVVCGDFNCVLSHSERLGGDSTTAEIDEFQQCLDICNLVDSPAMGSFFTWNNKQDVFTRVYSRLDRVLINAEWSVEMNGMCANFLPEGTFDHTPCLIQNLSRAEGCKKPFKYYSMWGKSPVYIANLTEWWKDDVQGTKMYKIIRKLKHLNHHLRKFNKDQFDDIENCSIRAMKNVEYIQSKLAADPRDSDWLSKEKQAQEEVKELNQVFSITDKDGVERIDPKGIKNAFLEYYKSLLGTEIDTEAVKLRIIQRGKVCDAHQWDQLFSPITQQEIKEAIFSIPDHKAPGLDGFSSSFFKDS